MKAAAWKWGTLVAMATSLFFGCTPASAGQSGGQIDVCKQVSAEQLKTLYRKQLYPTAYDNECNWSEKPGGMAELNIQVRDVQGSLRDYFADPLPSDVKLVKITDLGDEGMMSVVDGELGVIVIRKGKRVLQSALAFDMEPGSDKQAVLWDVYRGILKQM